MERYCTLTEKEDGSRESALETIRREAGIRFNPDIVEICCKISRQLS